MDILYLDIELFEVSGIDAGIFIRKQMENHTMQIIYISGKQSYAQQLFKVQPMDFLVKPIEEEKIEETLALALRLSGETQSALNSNWVKSIIMCLMEIFFAL